MGLLVSSKLINVNIPFLFKSIIDTMNANPAAAIATIPVGFIVAYGMARAGANLAQEARNAVFAKVSQRAVRQMACQTFLHLHKLDLGFHLSRRTGALSRAIDRGTRAVTFVMNAMVFNIIPTVLEIGLVCTILISSYGSSFAVVTMSTLGAYTVFTLGITQWRTKFRKQMNEMDNEASSTAIDSLMNYETVKYFQNEGVEADRYNRYLSRYSEAALKTQTSLSLLNFGQNAIFSTALASMMYLAANGVQAGTMTIGDMVMINQLLFQLSLPLNFLGSVYRELRQSLIDMDNLFQILHTNSNITDVDGAVTLPPATRGSVVEFRDVTFQYQGVAADTPPILNRVSFTVPAGSTLAIVGPSGSGKSTVLRLLYRFYDPLEGAIYIDGVNVAGVRLESLRSRYAVVPQDTVLFNDTIRYNIAYGKPDASEAELHAIAAKAHLTDAIAHMHDGWDTMVGERGLKVSGGEKQRVSIARAMLRNSPVLLCDEATSNLDSTTEKEILASLDELAKNRTTIIVAHRLSTIMHADEIIVLDTDGTIAERGTHQQLVAAGAAGLYAGMWEKQQSPEWEAEADAGVADADAGANVAPSSSK